MRSRSMSATSCLAYARLPSHHLQEVREVKPRSPQAPRNAIKDSGV